MARLVIVSNRVATPRAQPARAGGLAVALREALQRTGGLWFGWSGEVSRDAVYEPKLATAGRITYATVDLTPEDHEQFYLGYANGTLWPLFHYRLDRAEFRPETLDAYRRVNRAMAHALAPLLKPDDVLWIHDYHFLLLAQELRRLGVGNRIGFFLHIPFPPPEILSMAPHHEDLVRGLLAADLVGLQTPADVRALRRCVVDGATGVMAADGMVEAFGQRAWVLAFPIGIDATAFAEYAVEAHDNAEVVRLRLGLAGRALILGVDRLDYSKGLAEKIRSFGRLLELWPEHRSRVTFMQIAPVSRGGVAQYRALRREIDAAAGRVNGFYGDIGWVPIHYLNRSLARRTLAGFYRVARVGLVTPLRDGMNLVAKEYVAAQDPEDPGVLILSRFAGAAFQIQGALVVNPYDTDEVAEALHDALVMPLADRRARWRAMMAAVASNTIETWRENYLRALTTVVRAGVPGGTAGGTSSTPSASPTTVAHRS